LTCHNNSASLQPHVQLHAQCYIAQTLLRLVGKPCALIAHQAYCWSAISQANALEKACHMVACSWKPENLSHCGMQLKNADEVEFWERPDKEGWLQSQGEVIKTWRKRWFVLKDGFLFRFLDNKVSASSKIRGIVDLSKVRTPSTS
jgi:PH domain